MQSTDPELLHQTPRAEAPRGSGPGGPAAASPPDVDHAEQLPGQVAQGEGVQPERDRPEQHLWGKPHGKLLRAERGRAGSRQEGEEKGEEEGGGPGRARTCSRALEDARRVVWPSTSMGSRRQQMAPSRRDGVSAAETASAPGRNARTEPAGNGLCSSGFGMNVSSSATLRMQVVNFQNTPVGSGAKTNVQRQLSASQAGIPLEPPPKTAPWLMRKYIVLNSIF